MITLLAWAGMFLSGAAFFAAVRYGTMTLITRDAAKKRQLPARPPAADPIEITALHDQVMGPIEDVIAEGERRAQEEWDRAHAQARDKKKISLLLAGAKTVNETRAEAIAADDVHVLRIERAQLEAELERMAWDRGIPRSNRQFSMLMRQLTAIDRQIARAVAAGELRPE